MLRRRFLLGVGALALGASSRRATAQTRPTKIELGGLPTRVTSHPALAAELGLAELTVKRDDEAGRTFSGSKARKLEYLLADARAVGASSVLTFGGVGSNHALATAVHARAVGLGCHLVLLPEPPSEHAGWHMRAAQAQGASLYAGTRADREDPDGAARRFAPRERPYVIPMGGTNALGNLGYVDAGRELATQTGGERQEPEVIFAAAGTTGTVSGLLLGLREAGLGSRLVAVRVSGRHTANASRVAREIRATQALLRAHARRVAGAPLPGSGFVFEDRFAGPGYARPSEAGEAALARARAHGIELDATYTAKAFAALIAHAPSLTGQRVMFWNTFDPRRVASDDVSVSDLPARLRGYAVPR